MKLDIDPRDEWCGENFIPIFKDGGGAIIISPIL